MFALMSNAALWIVKRKVLWVGMENNKHDAHNSYEPFGKGTNLFKSKAVPL